MPRPRRIAAGGIAYHVFNRANARARIFHTEADYHAFEQVLAEAVARLNVRLCAYCVMPNHWHALVWPAEDDQLSDFFGWLAMTHTRRWHAYRHTTGTGHIYQDRFKSFPVETDHHFLTVARYVESNALRAGLVDRAELWRWSSLARRCNGSWAAANILSSWPTPIPDHWLTLVNEPLSKEQVEGIRVSLRRGRPFGSHVWQHQASERLGLQSTLNPRGRPALAPE